MQFSPNDRHILVITGEHTKTLNFAREMASNLAYVEIDEPKKANSFLGQEFDAVIFPTYSKDDQSFDANAFGAITGTIRGGGFLLLLKPEKYPAKSLFLKRFDHLLKKNHKVHFLKPQQSQKIKLPEPPRKIFTNVYANKDQEHAVAAIKKVVTGHRRRPLVITSDRGRGKSAALGIAAAELNKQGINKLIICAPSKTIATTVFHHASIRGYNNLQFYSPDELQQQLPDADLVMIDEAAAIPLALLTLLLKRYSRIVFASTQHGYEGSGRGFAINFRKILDTVSPEWKSCQLNMPIRWQDNDTLEKFTFDALLLNAEPAKTSLVKSSKVDDSSFIQIDKLELLENNALLKQVFGLLVSAHYQTKPSDLVHLLDDESITVFCLQSSNNITAVALLVHEGEIDKALSGKIFAGRRRVKGHLVAQSLVANVGIESAAELSAERIIRIAVHPHLQQQGFGKHLLNNIIHQAKQNSNIDYISTSYGLTEPLLQFWQGAGFTAVYLGMKRDASSGTHSLIMLHAKSNIGKKMLINAQQRFTKNYPHLLSGVLKNLETEIALALFPKPSSQRATPAPNPEDLKLLETFATSLRGYENTEDLIWQLVCQELTDRINKNKFLQESEKNILLIKVLQKHSWKETVEKMSERLEGKKEALLLLRQAVSKLLH
jgi:tRNA(Met) cytidine acetyltransferase